MVDRAVATVIDRERCIGCGECVRLCPSQTLEMKDGKAAVTGARSLGCGHCAAVCPVEAVRVEGLDPHGYRFHTFDCRTDWMPYGAFDAGELVRLMASRRSCRWFDQKNVERTLLEDLVRIGATAPSGTNSQSPAGPPPRSKTSERKRTNLASLKSGISAGNMHRNL